MNSEKSGNFEMRQIPFGAKIEAVFMKNEVGEDEGDESREKDLILCPKSRPRFLIPSLIPSLREAGVTCS